MRYSDILHNEHFNNIAAILRIPIRSHAWKQKYVHVPVWTLLGDLDKIRTPEFFKVRQRREDFVQKFSETLVALRSADPRLSYTEDDFKWFVSVMDSDQATTIMSLLFAWSSAPDEMLTPAEIAEQTGTAESGWRNKAAAGEIPGCAKKGKQWLLPKSVLKARGILK